MKETTLFRKLQDWSKRALRLSDSLMVDNAQIPVSDVVAAAQCDTSKSFGNLVPIDGEFYHDANGQPQQVWEVSNTHKDIEITYRGVQYPEGHPKYDANTTNIPYQQVVCSCPSLDVDPLDLVSVKGSYTRFSVASQKEMTAAMEADLVVISEPYINPTGRGKCIIVRPPAREVYDGDSTIKIGETETRTLSMTYAIRFTRNMEAVAAKMQAYQDSIFEKTKTRHDVLGENGEPILCSDGTPMYTEMGLYALGNDHETLSGTKIWVPKYEHTQGPTCAGDLAYINNDFGMPVEGKPNTTSGVFKLKPCGWFEKGATIKITNNIVMFVDAN